MLLEEELELVVPAIVELDELDELVVLAKVDDELEEEELLLVVLASVLQLVEELLLELLLDSSSTTADGKMRREVRLRRPG